MDGGAREAAVHGVANSRTWLSDFPFTFHFHALEKEMATHSSVPAWRIPGTGEPSGLPSVGSHRVGHDWSDLAAAAAAAELILPHWLYMHEVFLDLNPTFPASLSLRMLFIHSFWNTSSTSRKILLFPKFLAQTLLSLIYSFKSLSQVSLTQRLTTGFLVMMAMFHPYYVQPGGCWPNVPIVSLKDSYYECRT